MNKFFLIFSGSAIPLALSLKSRFMILSKSEYMLLRAPALIEPTISLVQIVRHFSAPWFPRHNLTNAELIDLLMGLQERNFIVAHNTPPHLRDAWWDDDNEVYRPPYPRRCCLKGDEFDLESWPITPLTPKIIEEQLQLGRKIAEVEKRTSRDVRSRQRKELESNIEHRYFYHVTPEGGEAWEKMARVDWNKYYTWSRYSWGSADLGPDHERSYGRIGATTLETLEAYFEWRQRWDNNVEPEKKLQCFSHWHVERVAPWKPLYWKTLPESYQCDFSEYVVCYPQEVKTPRRCGGNDPYHVAWEEHSRLFQWHVEPDFAS